MNWKMITLTYTRIPKSDKYSGSIQVVEVQKEGESLKEISLEGESILMESMKVLITKLHRLLRVYPQAKVTMVRPKPKVFLRQAAQDNPTAFELSGGERDIIRDDLEAAQKMFLPIHQTVGIAPTAQEESRNG